MDTAKALLGRQEEGTLGRERLNSSKHYLDDFIDGRDHSIGSYNTVGGSASRDDDGNYDLDAADDDKLVTRIRNARDRNYISAKKNARINKRGKKDGSYKESFEDIIDLIFE